ncbi:MAG: GDSL-type esterase/lipase family protein [Vicinamibacterales bacterium]
MPSAVRLLGLAAALALAAACSKGSDSPTSPTPTGSSGIVYGNISASDATGYMSSVECFPFTECAPNATGWVQTLFRKIQQTGTATINNTGVPGQVLSQHFEDLGKKIGRTYPGNFITNQVPFVKSTTTVLTIFAGGNDANTIGQVIQAQQAGDDLRAFIDREVAAFGDDMQALVRGVRQRAPNTKIVILNLPNLGAAPYMSRSSAVDRGIMQRIAVGMTGKINALAGANTVVVDLMCDARIIEPASFSSDGFHPSDRGYALMADLAFAAVSSSSYPAPAADCGQRRLAPVY